MRSVILLVGTAALLAGAASQFAARVGAPRSDRAPAATAPGPPLSSQSARSLVVGRERDGHFHVEAVVGGRRIPLLVDTGASMIALTQMDAERLAIRAGPNDPKLRVQTANGLVEVPRVRLAAVSIGGLTVRDVDAVVMPDRALSHNLLGMSFLSRLRRFEFRGSQLVLEQ